MRVKLQSTYLNFYESYVLQVEAAYKRSETATIRA